MKREAHKAISIEGLGKRYRVYFEKPALIRSILPFLVTQGKIQQFWALRNVNLDIEAGECVGIIGPNGSGKSTLLSILAGVTELTEGRLDIKGKVSSLLSLGAGFHFELTGQENIYLNSTILGLTKARIDALYKDIVEYADLGKFMSAKLSTYSAGMNMRLGFAIAIMIPFDILLIDEILGVGDLKFQTKCFKTMKNFYQSKKRTILFVSHDLAKIEELCTRVIWFEHGGIEQMGKPEEVLRAYKRRYKAKYRVPRIKRGKYIKSARKASISVDYEDGIRMIPPTLFGSNICWAAASGVMCGKKYRSPASAWINALKDLRPGILRFPGNREGDFFHWEKALGKRRPEQPYGYPGKSWQKKIRGKPKLVPMDIPGDMLVVHPYFGPDEFNQVAEGVSAEKLLVLNVATGTPDEGLAFLRYMDSIGRPVKFVELGHELYYDNHHEVGVTLPLSPEEYAAKVAEFSRTIRSYREDVRIIAMGCLDTGTFTRYRHPDWTEKILYLSGEWIDYIAVHNTEVPIFNLDQGYRRPSDRVSYEALMAAPQYVADNLRKVKQLLRSCRDRTGRDIKIAVTFYRTHFEDVPRNIHGVHRVARRENLHLNKARNRSLGAALYEAMLLNTFVREGAVEIATRAFLFHSCDSALWLVLPEGWCPNPQRTVMSAYARLAGKTLLKAEVRVDTFDSKQVGIIPEQRDVPYLDVIAARSEENEKLTLFVINRNLRQTVKADILTKGFMSRRIEVRGVDAGDFAAFNTIQNHENVRNLGHHFSPEIKENGTFPYLFPPHSLTILTLEKDEWF
ncbi:MAG: ATP-binding cassette domain-containing protein [Candidatus Tritonobacter lacicola]|nr:ATP-binding cassette domain-containing protein [Candidatus Tritonobacter lacicola]